MIERLMTTDEVARYLGFSTRTITHWAVVYEKTAGNRGLPALRIGPRQWRYRRDDVNDWVKLRQWRTG